MSRFVMLRYNIIDKKRKIKFNTLTNKFEKFSWINLFLTVSVLDDIIEISEDFFNKHVPMCDCVKNGEQPDLEYKRLQKNGAFYEHFGLDIFNEHFFEITGRTSMEHFYKIACLKCGTCNDQYDLMIKRFEEELEKIKEKERRQKMLNDICKK